MNIYPYLTSGIMSFFRKWENKGDTKYLEKVKFVKSVKFVLVCETSASEDSVKRVADSHKLSKKHSCLSNPVGLKSPGSVQIRNVHWGRVLSQWIKIISSIFSPRIVKILDYFLKSSFSPGFRKFAIFARVENFFSFRLVFPPG